MAAAKGYKLLIFLMGMNASRSLDVKSCHMDL